MTIQQLQYILEVQRTGSISQAAKHFLVSHSCVSSTISAMEEELGFPVFTRSWRGVVPTERGLEVLENAKVVCEYHGRILKAKGNSTRTIRIYSHRTQMFFHVFGQLVLEYREQKDTSFYHDHEGDRTKGMERVARFEAELFLVQALPDSVEDYGRQAMSLGLVMRDVGVVGAKACISKAHRLYHKEDLTLKDLKGETLIANTQGTNRYPSSLFKQIDFAPSRILRVYSAVTRQELLEQGVGYTVGTGAADKEGRRYIPIPNVHYRVLAFTNPNRAPVPEVERYLELLSQWTKKYALSDGE